MLRSILSMLQDARPSLCGRHGKSRRARANTFAIAPAAEVLEDRTLLSNYAVTITLDELDVAHGGTDTDTGLSLREAILDTNAATGADTIEFNIPNSDTGFVDVDSALTGGDAAADVFVIQPLSALPKLNDASGGTTIDGRTQTAFTGDTNPFGPEIVIDGSLSGGSALWLLTDDNAVLGLNVQGFSVHGIIISGGDNNVIAGNYVGTDATGTSSAANGGNGVFILNGGQNNVVGTNGDGTDDVQERNVISGNVLDGVLIDGSSTNANIVAGNYLGTDKDGAVSLGNGRRGVMIRNGAQDTRVGTDGDGSSDAMERNVISGNAKSGIGIDGANANIVAGNFIGTNASGTAAIANASNGVFISGGSQSNLVGTDGDGTADGDERNIVSGNSAHGVHIDGADNNRIAGNYIGTNASGASGLGNAVHGVTITGAAQGNTIGTDDTGNGHDANERNVISANGNKGVDIRDIGTDFNVVAGNYIGTTADGLTALGNVRHGVNIWLGASFNRVGTDGDDVADVDERNVISGNDLGVIISESGTRKNVVAGNYIGTDRSGALALSNSNGLFIAAGASENTIGTDGDGTADAAERNIFSGNLGWGISIAGDGTDGNIIAGNFVGTDCDGDAAIGNGGGILVRNAAEFNTIGTDGSNDPFNGNERNVISGNTVEGLRFIRSASNNVVAGNYIGTDGSGTIALGNGSYGIRILNDFTNPIAANGSQSNRIGTNGDGIADGEERNVISGNGADGVHIQGVGSDNNVVAGNYIGTDVSGTAALGNVSSGVAISANSNRIGTDGNGVADDVERNVIAGNGGNGVNVGGDGNIIAGNYIGTDASGGIALANFFNGIFLGGGASGNVIGTAGSNDTLNANERNVISGNSSNGIWIDGFGADNNIVSGNYIGTDKDGEVTLGNDGRGVLIASGATNNRIGTNGDGVSDTTERNIISASFFAGVDIVASNANVVAGNYIGTDKDGDTAMANSTGVLVRDGAQFNVIGTDGSADGHNAGEGNVISGNVGDGVRFVRAASNNIVAGNYIGTDATATQMLANTESGVYILNDFTNPIAANGSQSNRIGTNGDGIADTEERNVISGNAVDGVRIQGAGSDNNVVAGNYIGTKANGTEALGNTGQGIIIFGGAKNNRFGTDGDNSPGDAQEGNLISANLGSGIDILGAGTDGTFVAGNYVGTKADGTGNLGNAGNGVQLLNSAAGTTIGGNSDVFRNVISGNGSNGIWVSGTSPINTVVSGNYIGIDINGAELGNAAAGIYMSAGTGNLIGGGSPGAGNVISGNDAYGVVLITSLVVDNTLQGNRIGTDPSGTSAAPNQQAGIYMAGGASSNRIGTDGDGSSDADERNVISGNGADGVHIQGIGTDFNILAGNAIGTDQSGTTNVGNGGNGVLISAGAQSNLIGAASDVGANVIAFNAGAGVAITDDSTGNAIRLNATHSNDALGIDLGDDGVTGNDLGSPPDQDTGPNNLQNSPEVALAKVTSDTTIEGDLHSTPNSSFAIDVYANTAEVPAAPVEGERFLTSVTVMTDGNGDAAFSVVLPQSATSAGELVTATATDASGNTSEFSAGFIVTGKNGNQLITGGGNGNDQINLTSGSVIVTINDIEVGEFFDVTDVEVFGLGGDDVITVAETLTQSTMLDGGDGNDTITGGGGDDVIVGGDGSDVINGGEGNDDLDGGAGDDQLDGGEGNDTLDGGTGNDAVDGGPGADSITTGDGSDTVTSDADDDLGGFGLNILSPVSLTAGSTAVRGQDLSLQAVFSVSGSTVAWDFDDGNTASGATTRHAYETTGGFDVVAQITDPSSQITTLMRHVDITITAMQIDPADAAESALAVGGTPGADSIFIDKNSSVEAFVDGTSLGVFSPTGRLLVYAQGGNDEVEIAGSIALPAWLFGGAGNDTLKGGGGSNVLLGDEGDDQVIGGGARDLLVGGFGSDHLVGQGSDDLLIASRLNFADLEPALAAIMAEWNSERTYAARVRNLANDGADSNRANGNVFLTAGETVVEDSDADTLTGGAGREWFFFDPDDDKVTDRMLDEVFGNDLDWLL